MTINIVPQAGLCNRLRVIFSYLKLANASNNTLNVFWVVSPACNGSFLDVFQPVKNITFVNNRPKKVDYAGYSPVSPLSKKDYQLLAPKDNILYKIVKTIEEKTPYNAVHIRRTDHVNYAKKKQTITDDMVFEKFIEKSNLPVFLACDNSETQQKFLKKYSEKIFVNQIIEKSRNKRQTTLENTVIDLFLCIKSQNFLGTKLSSYSDLIRLLK